MFGLFKKEEVTEYEQRAVTVGSVDSIFTSSSTSDVNSISTAYACIRLLTNNTAMTYLKHYEKTEDGNEEQETSRISSLIRNPAPNVSYFQFMQNITNDFIGRGNGYAIIIRENGSPIELLYVPSTQVSIFVTQDSNYPYYYQISKDGRSFRMSPEDMIHVKNISLDGIVGLSPIQVHRLTFDAATSINEYNKTFMDNATSISGILSTDKKLKKETVDDLRKNFGSKFGGASNAGKTPVLSEGMQYDQLKAVSPLDADYIATRKLNKSDIAEIFGVPLSMLGSVESTYTNAEQLALIYNNYTMQPIFEMISQELSLKLIPRYNRTKQRLEFYVDTLKLASSKEKAETVSLLKNTGIVTANESREYYGLQKMDGGDILGEPETEVGDEVQAPKNTDETNVAPATPETTSKDIRSAEVINLEIHKLKSELGRVEKNN